ncbi:hypothetical protein COK29_26470, partial [Bacillus cereus]
MKGANALGKGAMELGRNAKDKLQGGDQSRGETPKRSEDEGTGSGEAQDTVSSRGGIAKRIGTATGYVGNRGARGMMNDVGDKMMSGVNGMYESGKSKMSAVATDVKDGVKGTVSEFKEGQEQGRQTAQHNADRDTLNQIGKDVKQNADQGNDSAVKVENGNANVSRMSGTEANGSELKGTNKDIQKDINLQKQLRNTGVDTSQGSETKGDAGTEQVQKDLAMQEKLNNNGKVNVSETDNEGATGQIQRDLTMQEQVRNNGTASQSGTEVKGSNQTVSRD